MSKRIPDLFLNRFLILLLAVSSVSLTVPASAAPPGFDEGVRAYQARHYNVALEQFTKAARSAPNDATVHYYLGLCYQSTNQVSLAKQQYDWVIACSPIPSLRSQASMALSQLSKFQMSRAGSSFSSPVVSGSQTRIASGPKISGRLKVIEFYTDH